MCKHGFKTIISYYDNVDPELDNLSNSEVIQARFQNNYILLWKCREL